MGLVPANIAGMKFAWFFLLLSACTIEAHGQTTPPSYIEFSTFLQLRPGASNNNVPMLTAPGSAGEFYVAGTLGGTQLELLAFPKQPINAVPGFNSMGKPLVRPVRLEEV